MAEKIDVTLRINGVERTYSVPAGRRLLDLLREDAGLTGAKEGCGAGECGACTVLFDGEPVPSCLVLASCAHGHEVQTVESLVSDDKTLHPIVDSMVATGGVQCGFCTPGIIMTSVAVAAEGIADTEEQRRLLSGNLCRCTGYEKIFNAIERALQTEATDD